MSTSTHNLPTRLVSQLLADDPEMRDIVEDFVGGLDERLRELREAYAKLDWQALCTYAHRMKGASGSYGFPDMSKLCGTMEDNFKAQRADQFADWAAQFEALTQAAKAGLQ